MTARRRKSRGFSLVEVLVGVMILGLVVSPLLHTMVTAMNTAAKGRRAQNLNMIAQNLVETVDANTIAALTGTSTDGTAPFLSIGDASIYQKSSETGSYSVAEVVPSSSPYYIGVTGINYPGSSVAYDAMIELDATPHDQNAEKVSIYTSMDSVFTQPAAQSDNPDTVAAAYFAEQADAAYMEFTKLHQNWTVASPPSSRDFFFGNNGTTMNRTVTIAQTDRSKAEDGTTNAEPELASINGKVTYAYTASFQLSYTDENEADGLQTISLGRTESAALDFTVGEQQSPTAPKAFYFFFYPNFGGSDTLAIRRGDLYPLRVFLVRQDPPLYFGTDPAAQQAWNSAVSTAQNKYFPDVQLWESYHPSLTGPVAQVYLNFQTGSPLIKYGFKYVTSYNGINQYEYKPAVDSLVVQDVRERIYTVTVKLYPEGTHFAENTRLTTLTATTVK